jgi:putative copper resistance protein D
MTIGTQLPRLTLGRAFTEWALHPWTALVLAVLVVGYLIGVWRARRTGESVRSRDVASWLAGIAVLVIATQGSPAVYGDALFWMHMVAHLMLIMIAPLLLVAARPLDLLVAATRTERRDRVRGVLEGRIVSGLTHPSFGLVAYTAVIIGTHLTGFMNSMMMHPWLRGFEAALYVVSGVLFFLPLIGDPPIRWKLAAPLRMALFVVAMPVDTFTGVILSQENHYPWPMMAAMHPSWGPGLVTDLHAGGAVMWIGGDAIMFVLIGVAAVRWARQAAAGDGSELGGWLSAARATYQHDLTADSTADGVAAPDADSDEALAAYNSYLQKMSARRG